MTDATGNSMVRTVDAPTETMVEAPTTPALEIPPVPTMPELPTSTPVIDAITGAIPEILALAATSEDVKQGVDTFLEMVPHFLQALDEVANLHPYIKGASSFY
jgi:hypothetical protein